MADDEDAEGEEVPEEAEEASDETEAEEEGDEKADVEDEVPEEAADEGDETPGEAADEEEEEGDSEAGDVDEEDDADDAEEAPEDTADADDDDEDEDGGDEVPGEAADEEAADEEAGDEEEDEDLEEIETAMAGEGEEDEEEPPSQPTVSTDGRFYGTGRRKEAVARVWIEAGNGEVTVNDSDLSAYFSSRAKWTAAVRGPLECLGMEDSVDVWATVEGGGLTGQADAIELGLARALVEMDENARHWLRPEGHLTRDDREVERKKINQPGARAKSQVSKR